MAMDDQRVVRVAAHDAGSEERRLADLVAPGQADEVVLRNAIARLGEAGGTIELSAGTFEVSGPTELVDRIQIKGQGPDATLLRLDPDHASLGLHTGVLLLKGEGGTVRDLAIDAGNPDPRRVDNPRERSSGIYLDPSSVAARVENVSIANTTRHGIAILGRNHILRQIRAEKAGTGYCLSIGDGSRVRPGAFNIRIEELYVRDSGERSGIEINDGVDGVVIDGFYVGGFGGSRGGVHVRHHGRDREFVRNVTLRNGTIDLADTMIEYENPGAYGIIIRSHGADNPFENFLLEDIVIRHASADAIWIRGNVREVRIRGLRTERVGGRPLAVDAPGGAAARGIIWEDAKMNTSDVEHDRTIPSWGPLKKDGIFHPEVRPAAVYHAGSTYVTWVDAQGQVGVTRMRHDDGKVENVVVGETEINDHTLPSILIREPDHRVVLFWTLHNGDHVFWRISAAPGDISSFGPTYSFPAPSSCYTQPVQLMGKGEEGRVYLFYRSRNRWLYRCSQDGAETFGEPVELLANYAPRRPRIQVVGDGDRRIHIQDGAAYEGIWHLYYEAGAVYRSDGSLIRPVEDLPVRHRDELTLVYDHTLPGNHDTRGCDLALDAAGRPYSTFTIRVDHHRDHRFGYARWTGEQWVHFEVGPAGGSVKDSGFPMSGGIYLNHDNPSVVYTAREVRPKEWEIFVLETVDGGESWEERTHIPGRTGSRNFRPIYVRNHARAKPGTAVEIVWNAGEMDGGRGVGGFATDIWAWPMVNVR